MSYVYNALMYSMQNLYVPVMYYELFKMNKLDGVHTYVWTAHVEYGCGNGV